MEEGRELMAQLYDRERDLHEQIINLEKEIGMHKKEIKSRDVSIGEKEKRVYELKKKNQELGKIIASLLPLLKVLLCPMTYNASCEPVHFKYLYIYCMCTYSLQ